MARARSTTNTPESDSLFGAAILSALLHAAVLFGAFVVWPFVAPPTELPSDVVPVDLVTVADMTNIAPADKADEKPIEQPPPPEPPVPEPQQQEQASAEPPAPPPPPEPEDAAPDAEAVKPEPPKPEPPKPPEPPVERYAMASPRTKPKPDKPKDDFDLDKIMKGIDTQPAEKKAPATKAVADQPRRGAGAQTALTASEIDALKAKLRQCWNVPVGAPDLSALVFRVRFSLNEDGTVSGAPELLDKGKLGDPYFRAAADSAIRAIHMCGPYELPPQKYAGPSGWNEITITFDPTNMGY